MSQSAPNPSDPSVLLQTHFSFAPARAPAAAARRDVLSALADEAQSSPQGADRRPLAMLDVGCGPGICSIAIADMLPGDTRTGPLYPLLFALNMLLNTTAGDTFTVAQYTEWLGEAGFAEVSRCAIGSHSPAILATRP